MGQQKMDHQIYEAVEYRRTQMQKELILKQLREHGCRITRQRKMLLDIILEGDCSSCKEIYYRAIKRDNHIGKATVYRMVNTLEAMGAISRKNMYRLSCDDENTGVEVCTVELSDNSVVHLDRDQWFTVIRDGLKADGTVENQSIRRIHVIGM